MKVTGQAQCEKHHFVCTHQAADCFHTTYSPVHHVFPAGPVHGLVKCYLESSDIGQKCASHYLILYFCGVGAHGDACTATISDVFCARI